MGYGITAFVIAYISIHWPRIPPPRQASGLGLLAIALISWCYSCLGGILFALTRIAYPPTPRPGHQTAV